ncbi:type II toxin-antitoxin system RelE/ParE family toxin (plasmid) [Acuticoccus sp. MNP-M23]|uniref:type II toxin-antitoxin system RelE/ParE family toxin n=1 Tax=Acuticoccus sp. MNP-M23 TaxID=3072793 RepID=UPI0028167A7B|nr:type II toxin-antitoxin system RelE/ParE family toxin [Acuticoccus sp. MNP-M23]WMS45286.1 type II toxin-antitoxin system RelE/ParE family toxin [Acuticoccus sp. MNP-M23]
MADGPVRAYQLTPAAQSDLETIWRFTANRWSVGQAEAYLNGLRDALEDLIANPRIARERLELTPPVRVQPYGSHIIIYTIEIDYLAVIRIRHSRENWISDPAGEDE